MIHEVILSAIHTLFKHIAIDSSFYAAAFFVIAVYQLIFNGFILIFTQIFVILQFEHQKSDIQLLKIKIPPNIGNVSSFHTGPCVS